MVTNFFNLDDQKGSDERDGKQTTVAKSLAHNSDDKKCDDLSSFKLKTSMFL